MDCFSNFDRVRGWFDTEFQDSEGFTVSSALHTGHTKNIKLSALVLVFTMKFMYHIRLYCLHLL